MNAGSGTVGLEIGTLKDMNLETVLADGGAAKATIVVGGSYVAAKDALGALGRTRVDPATSEAEDVKWAYVMTNVAF